MPFIDGETLREKLNRETQLGIEEAPELSFVTLKVFDVLGNAVETLVNEEKNVGTYEITWYAKQLPSGIYFYRIQAGNFVETKKMVLMK